MLGIDGDYQLVVGNDSGTAASGGNGGRTGGGGGVSGSGGMTGGNGGTMSGGTGATSGSGGVVTTGGVAGSGGFLLGDASLSCASGTKLCPVPTSMGPDAGPMLQCVPPDPSVGCNPNGSCDPCPPPPQGAFQTCNGSTCGWQCFEAFTQMGDTCVPLDAGMGGTGGQGGTGGTGPMTCTTDTDCPPCGAAIGCCGFMPPPRLCGCNFVYCVVFP